MTRQSLCVHVPGEIDEKGEPEQTLEHGVMKVSFPKRKKAEPRRITIKKR